MTTDRRKGHTMRNKLRHIYYEWPEKHSDMPFCLAVAALVISIVMPIVRAILA